MDCKVDNMPVYVITSTKTGNEKVVHRNKLLVLQLAGKPKENQVPENEWPLQPQLIVEEAVLKGNEPPLELPTGGVGTKLEVRDSSASMSTLKEGAAWGSTSPRKTCSEATGAQHYIVNLSEWWKQVWGAKIPTLQLISMTWEALMVDIVKGTPELIWAGVHDAVPHEDLHTMNIWNHEISVPGDRKFLF